MSAATMTRPRASQLLLAALIAGLDGNLLLRGGQWRAGFAVWIAGLAVTVLLLGGRVGRERLLMLIGITFAACGLAWRDAELLYTIDLLSVLCMGALLLWHGTGRSVTGLTLVQTVRAGVLAVLNTIGGAPGLLTRSDVDATTVSSARRNARAIAIGVALAALPLFIVTGLLTSSDVVFRSAMDSVFSGVLQNGFSHVVVTLLVTYVAAGWLRAALGDPVATSLIDPQSPRVPFITVAVGLYALLALLLAFVLTQARVLFGGAEFLRTTANLTVATYARDGFFQLIAAAGIVLVVMVMADWLLADDDVDGRRHARRVSGALVVLVSCLLVSSATRIALYVQEFGLSVDRAFASAAILWVGGVLVAFAVTTLRGASGRFMHRAILVTVGWVALVNVSNPEAIVMRVNLSRAAAGAPFDAAYHAKLSADALPTLREGVAQLTPAQCAALDAALRTHWATRLADPEDGQGDWRSTNLSLMAARRWMTSETVVCGAGR